MFDQRASSGDNITIIEGITTEAKGQAAIGQGEEVECAVTRVVKAKCSRANNGRGDSSIRNSIEVKVKGNGLCGSRGSDEGCDRA